MAAVAYRKVEVCQFHIDFKLKPSEHQSRFIIWFPNYILVLIFVFWCVMFTKPIRTVWAIRVTVYRIHNLPRETVRQVVAPSYFCKIIAYRWPIRSQKKEIAGSKLAQRRGNLWFSLSRTIILTVISSSVWRCGYRSCRQNTAHSTQT